MKRDDKEYNNPNYSTAQRAKYGQNYIKDPSLVRRLLDKTTVGAEDIVLEIGPGEGAFTSEILERTGKLVTIEIDKENVEHLQSEYKNDVANKKLEIIHKDALLFEPRWAKASIEDGEYKIVASIPYSISSQLFKKFLLKRPMPSEAWFTVQREFAQRAAITTTKSGLVVGESGLLSVLINSFYEAEIVHKFKREDFSPVPSVDSVFLQLTARHDVPELVTLNFGQYKDFVRDGFAQPIRTVQKHFSKLINSDKLQQLADKYKFKLKEQTTELTARQWQALFVALN